MRSKANRHYQHKWWIATDAKKILTIIDPGQVAWIGYSALL